MTHERVPCSDSLAKYAVSFLCTSRSRRASANSRRSRAFSAFNSETERAPAPAPVRALPLRSNSLAYSESPSAWPPPPQKTLAQGQASPPRPDPKASTAAAPLRRGRLVRQIVCLLQPLLQAQCPRFDLQMERVIPAPSFPQVPHAFHRLGRRYGARKCDEGLHQTSPARTDTRRTAPTPALARRAWTPN